MGYTRSELLDRVSSEEITLWVAEYVIRAEEDEKAAKKMEKNKGKGNKPKGRD